MKSNLCCKCKVILTVENSSPSIFKRGVGYCRNCFKIWSDSKDYRKQSAGIFKRGYRRTLLGHYSKLKRALRKENVDSSDLLWNLHFYAELIKDNSCHYCWMPLSPCGHGLDRVNNSIGHFCFNVVPCCGQCNAIKGSFWDYKHMMNLSPEIREIKNLVDAR
jgi:hypothetical protein